MFKTGFIPPTAETHASFDENNKLIIECPQQYPDLEQKLGNPWQNIPKMIHAMKIFPSTGQTMYLCSWKQDFLQYFYTPSWVLSSLLMDKNSESLQNYKLIAEFYQYFADNSEVVKLNKQTSSSA